MTQKTQRGPGRPRLPKAIKQSELISVRLTRSEKRMVAQMARKAGVSISTFMRKQALGIRE